MYAIMLALIQAHSILKYTQIGASDTKVNLIRSIEDRFKILNILSCEIRIEQCYFTNEKLDENGCPISKETIKKEQAKVITVIKEHEHHNCQFKWHIVCIIYHKALESSAATTLFKKSVPLVLNRVPELIKNITNKSIRIC